MSEFMFPKDCREPDYQEFALSRWKKMSDEKRHIILEYKKLQIIINLLDIPENGKENLYRQMNGMPLVEGEEFLLSDYKQHLVKMIKDGVKEFNGEEK